MKVLASATSNPFCVPAALSAITGKHVDEVILFIREYLGDQPISGVYYPVALAILQKLGYSHREVNKIRPHGVFLCCSRSHMYVVADGRMFDNAHPEGAIKSTHRLIKCFEISKGDSK